MKTILATTVAVVIAIGAALYTALPMTVSYEPIEIDVKIEIGEIAKIEDEGSGVAAAPVPKAAVNVVPAHFGDATEEEVAFLRVIFQKESGGRHDVIYGGETFADYSRHPRRRVEIKSGPNAGRFTTAAGIAQFLYGTWKRLKEAYDLPDFSAQSQEFAALMLAREDFEKRTGEKLADVLSSRRWEDVARAGRTLSPTWTSLPSGIEATWKAGDLFEAFLHELHKLRGEALTNDLS